MPFVSLRPAAPIAALALVACLLAAGTDTAAAADDVAPSPTPAATDFSMPAGCSIDSSVLPYETAFGRAITGSDRLRFIDRARTLDLKALTALLKSPADGARSARLAAAAAAACVGPLVSTIADRAFDILANRYDVNLEYDGQVRLKNALVDAAAAVVAPGVDSGDATAALAPFGTSLAELRAASPVAGTCAKPNVDATLVARARVVYPDAARALRETGKVVVKVALDTDGHVTDERVYTSDVPPASTLVDETLVAIGESGFAPRYVNCVPVAGTYLYVAEFRMR